MSDISGSGPISPRERRMYEQEYKHSAELFQKALEQSAKSDNQYQQEQFGEVMGKAMDVLNQTAQGLKRKDLMEQNSKIAADYQAYQSSPADEARRAKLNQDLDRAKHSF